VASHIGVRDLGGPVKRCHEIANSRSAISRSLQVCGVQASATRTGVIGESTHRDLEVEVSTR
jgi:hypothetical protein